MLPNAKTKWLALGLGLALFSSASLASEIYRWTDEDGNVHYGDRPTGVAEEERLAIKSAPTDNAAVQERYDERYASSTTEARRAAAAEREENEDPPPTRSERYEARMEKEAECERSRESLERVESRRRLYRLDEDGERVYLNDDEIDQARSQARERVAENCG